MRPCLSRVGHISTAFALTIAAALVPDATVDGQELPDPVGWYAMDVAGMYGARTEAARRPGGTGWLTASLRSADHAPTATGMSLQSIRADAYRGRRVRLTGFVRTSDVAGAAGFFMRVDGAGTTQASDYMQQRPVTGTQAWTARSIVLDVPHDASGITFGFYLAGTGQVWVDDLAVETVGLDVPLSGVTGHQLSRGGNGFVIRLATLSGSSQADVQRVLERLQGEAYDGAPGAPVNLDFEQLKAVAEP